MKTYLTFLVLLLVLPLSFSAQQIEKIDEITPFHEGLAGIRQGQSWGFINKQGEKIIDFRDDMVWNSQVIKNISYPYFDSSRCMITSSNEGINYYGYMDYNGKNVISPKYLNATAFENGFAIVIKMYKEESSSTTVLEKMIVNYSFNEVLIDPSNKVVMVLRGPLNLLFSKEKLENPPEIRSKILSKDLVAVKNEKDQWEIYKIGK